MHYPIDIGIKTFFQEKTSLASDDIFISSIAWAFRNRLRRTQELRFPFICFRLAPGGIRKPDTTWVQNYHVTHGTFFSEISDRVKVIPYFAQYEAIFWSHKYYNAYQIFKDFFERNFDDLTFEYNYIINGEEYSFTGSLEFTNLELDPEFNEDDELRRAKLHSVDLSFEVKAFTFTGQGVQLADGAVLDLFYNGEFTTTLPDDTGTEVEADYERWHTGN